MLSHDLARELLARRNNDVRIEVLVDDDPTGEEYTTRMTALREDDDTVDPDLRAYVAQVGPVRYNALSDELVILAGCIVIKDPDNDDA